ncbi:hypothetical protein C8R43DRAFT_954174 [Mycena crocata]|nr:hypothetical protein C8R43DRAFT_954174 [Mycena crocata]
MATTLSLLANLASIASLVVGGIPAASENIRKLSKSYGPGGHLGQLIIELAFIHQNITENAIIPLKGSPANAEAIFRGFFSLFGRKKFNVTVTDIQKFNSQRLDRVGVQNVQWIGSVWSARQQNLYLKLVTVFANSIFRQPHNLMRPKNHCQKLEMRSNGAWNQ